jgi:RNA polymerase sigma-70 factor (ECF subfamily)
MRSRSITKGFTGSKKSERRRLYEVSAPANHVERLNLFPASTYRMCRQMAEETQNTQPGSAGDDLSLVARVLEGDRRCFELLVRRHERRVFRVALAVLGNIEDAEDAMQETFIKAFRHLDQFRAESRFTTWLTRIAVNEALQKRQARKESIPLDESREAGEKPLPRRFEPWTANPEQLYGQQELRQLVETALQALPPIYREVLILRDIEGIAPKRPPRRLI